ncbi:V-type ATP synthase subunit A [Faecalibacillus faecis]|uniref:V-type ATP synthase subunit A n=1 Tax=Faecalibacillus faecis TaxID=1982628 RepID=UPI000664B419|nr:V-type ATP synthase subunit A [Faecalibacillus faecis]KMV77181.1 V-type ATP synthase alpha chain 2 (V-type ATPase subunitA 2) [Coprobacillus sp. 8_1_38FAA]RHB01954.1 V-type ATP synthase subunit A [Coprobacillus sp. AM42-12AC]RHH10391.1 V-type ATP synthase subunit A [Coprobacillus sp. AM18-4LB-d2]
MSENVIYSINGPVVKVKNAKDFSMLEMVYVGHAKLMGEVISISKDLTTIQVYETTTGLKPGEPVISTGSPICVTLGPGILRNIFDGIERPLQAIAEQSGAFIEAGSDVDSLDIEKLWDVTMKVKVGDVLKGGDIYATCPETDLIEHRCMLSPLLSGKVVEVKENGQYKINDVVMKIEDEHGQIHECTLCQKWPIKQARPTLERLPISIPLVTGQRVIDTLFPIAKGGTAAIPGGFGTGKTMTQHQIAKWCDADIIIYVGCGERGNEMTQVLEEFSELIDPKSGKPLTDRTVLIANTSNMPVAAREASIYTGITLAEYYRDMGYHCAIMADSTSRWAEALREISGRLEEMPAEEGFPAYLPSRLSQFYERAGYMKTLNGQEGSVSIIGAVSPQGADFSEPVTQNTKRFVRCFWALDKALAYARHYFAINWTQSYSDYVYDLEKWYDQNVGSDFVSDRQQLSFILAEESRLNEIVNLMGPDVLPEDQKLVMEIAKVVRVGYLQQNAFHKDDTYVPLAKQLKMMDVILYLNKKCQEAVAQGKVVRAISETGIFEQLIKMKYDIPNDHIEKLDTYYQDIDNALKSVA